MTQTTIQGSAVRALARLSKVVEAVLAEESLSVSQFRILDRLSDGSTHGRSLAEWLAVKPPSVTGVVDGLVKRGLVSRSEDGADRRQVEHALTPAGELLRTTLSKRIANRLDEVAGHVGDADAIGRMIESLAMWDVAFEAMRGARQLDRGAVT